MSTGSDRSEARNIASKYFNLPTDNEDSKKIIRAVAEGIVWGRHDALSKAFDALTEIDAEARR
jgi:hypothetical protein